MDAEGNMERGLMVDRGAADDDAMTFLCQFLFVLIQIIHEFPELLGFDTPSPLEGDIYEEDVEMDFTAIQVARMLCNRWLIYQILDDYNDGHKWWVKPRSTAWFYTFLMDYYGDDRWIENMHMTRDSFCELCNILGPSIVKKDTNYRKALSVFARVGAAIYKLTSGDGFNKVAEKFAMGKTSVKRVLHEVCDAIVEHLQHLISLPVGQELIDVSIAFEKHCGLPNIVGAVDVMHIPIVAPCMPHYRDYFKLGKYSICLQAVCDSSWRFRDIYVGMPGSVHDTRVFKYSSLWSRARQGIIYNEDPQIFPWGVNIRPYLLGDSGYPLASWLIVPIQHLEEGGQLTREEKYFNDKHRRGRRHVEQTFDLLKKVFKEFNQKSELSVIILPSIVNACCILHNFMIGKQENDYQELLTEWEIENVGADEHPEQQVLVIPGVEGGHRDLQEEELNGLESTATLVAYLDARRRRPRHQNQ